MEKLYISYEEVHLLIEKIAQQIEDDKWMPDSIVAIANGGFIPSRILRNYIKKNIYIVGLRRYDNDKVAHEIPVKVQWIDEIEKKLQGEKILLVDEIDDTRVTLSYCLKELLKCKPAEIRVAVLHQKLKKKNAQFPQSVTKIYQGEEIPDTWIIYPWEALDIHEHMALCRQKFC